MSSWTQKSPNRLPKISLNTEKNRKTTKNFRGTWKILTKFFEKSLWNQKVVAGEEKANQTP